MTWSTRTATKKRYDWPPVLTREQAAAYLQVHTNTVDNMVKDGRLPKVAQMGKHVRIPLIALERLVSGGQG